MTANSEGQSSSNEPRATSPADLPPSSVVRRNSLSWVGIGILALLVLAAAACLWGPRYYRTGDYWRTFLAGRCAVYLLALVILAAILRARRGERVFIRRIPGLTAIDETVGRATEMARPITFSLGLGGLDIVTLQALAIALHVIRMAIRFGTRVILTMTDGALFAVADEAVSEAYAAAGSPESFNRDDVRFLSDRQFAYASAMVGIIHREQVASSYMFGTFFAESLILAEAGNQVGAIQVAGTPTITQLPFFIAACDYTIIGDEYYAATAYLTREPVLSGSLVGQDRAKILLLALILLAIVTTTILTLTGSPGAKAWAQALAALFTNAK